MDKVYYDVLDQAIKRRGYSRKTYDAYAMWMRRYLLYLSPRSLEQSTRQDVERYLTHLAVDREVAAATQNQALSALLFIFQHVVSRPVGFLSGIERAKPTDHLPTTLSATELTMLFEKLEGTELLVAQLLYGAGLRVGEAVSLRIQDIDISKAQLEIRDAKGKRDRITFLPKRVAPQLSQAMQRAKRCFAADLQSNTRVSLPHAFERKSPNAAKEWRWRWLFPAKTTRADSQYSRVREHMHASGIQRAIRRAANEADITRRVTCHTLRHSFATDLVERGVDIKTVARLMGHKDIRTTQIYVHTCLRKRGGLTSPLDW